MMKIKLHKIYTLLILLLIPLQNSFAQNDWYFQNPYPQGNDIVDAVYYDDHTVIAITSKSILRSVDSGVTWEIIRVGEDTYSVIKKMANTSLMIGGKNGLFLVSGDQGKTWSPFNITAEPNGMITDLSFGASSAGQYIIGAIVNFQKIYCTYDFGVTWYFQHETVKRLLSIECAHYSTCYAGGDDGIFLKSNNNGVNWFDLPFMYSSYSITDIYYINTKILITTNVGWVMKSTDNGTSWDYIFDTQDYIQKLCTFKPLIPQDMLWLITREGKVAYSKNIDSSWQMLNNGLIGINFNTISFSNENNGFIGGYAGLIYMTEDGGISWQKISRGTNVSFYGVDFIDYQTGWVVGGSGSIYKTTNGGINWNFQANPYQNGKGLYDVDFSIDGQNGWAVSGYANTYGVLRTTNGGENWFEDNPPDAAYGFLDVEKNYFVGYGGQFYSHSISGWHKNNLNTFATLFAFSSPVNESYFMHQWIVGGNSGTGESAIFHTTDTGIHWVQQASATNKEIHDVFALSPSLVWAVGDNATIQKTTDGGANWILLTEGELIEYGYWFNKVKFIDENNGWVAGVGGFIFKTTDGGNIWEKIQLPTNQQIFAFDLADNPTFWYDFYLVGPSGLILKSGQPQATEITVDENKKIPKEFLLSQNYPNPFNPSTKIQYSLPSPSEGEGSGVRSVMLKIYDVLGNEIATLVNEEKSPGNYEVVFDAKGLSSGIYFYRLTTGGKNISKKMLLIK